LCRDEGGNDEEDGPSMNITSRTVDGLRRLSERTPAQRDRYADFLRILSIGMVVLGHYLGTVITVTAGRIGQRSLLEVSPQLKVLTWVLQIMPVFFFVGGFSNYTSLEASQRRGESVGAYLRRRSSRLLKPALVFLGVWTGVEVLFHGFGVGGSGLLRLSSLPFGPLWFLGVYLGVVAISPLMMVLHRRFRIGTVVGLIVATEAVDVAHHGLGIGWIGWANFGFAWLVAHQLGFFYADGTLTRMSRRGLAIMAGAGLAALVVFTASGLYPLSMVGNATDRFSNMSPPTLCIVAMSFWLVGLTMLAREPVSRWLARPRPWMTVIAGNQMCMTIYLWHLTAMLIAAKVMLSLGLSPTVGQPLFLGTAFAGLICLVAIFRRFEQPTIGRVVASPGR
jgi:fucose 4-O-acetylase-like acetyltransferase